MRVDRGEVQIEELAEGPRPFRALYEHWERHQWSPFAIDFSTDAASFAALDEPTRDGLVMVFAHRFHAEFNVAALLAPFLLAAPDYDVRLLLATQVADEHRHIESVLRVYSDVFAVEGGIAAVKAVADAQLDPVAAALYAALDGIIGALEASRDEDSFLRAVVAYHLIAEGSIGRANQNFAAAQFDRVAHPLTTLLTLDAHRTYSRPGCQRVKIALPGFGLNKRIEPRSCFSARPGIRALDRLQRSRSHCSHLQDF